MSIFPASIDMGMERITLLVVEAGVAKSKKE